MAGAGGYTVVPVAGGVGEKVGASLGTGYRLYLTATSKLSKVNITQRII